MGIAERLKNWDPTKWDGRTDFDDAPAPVYRPRVEREMIREVKGATDLRDAMPPRMPNMNAGMVTVDPDLQRRDPRPFKDEVDTEAMRPAQKGKIWHLMNQLRQMDPAAGAAADAWWDRQDGVLKVQASEWIDRLKAKIVEVASNPEGTPIVQPAPVVTRSLPSAWAEWRELAARLVKVGGSRGTRFAVDTEAGATNSIAFWRISPSRDGQRFYLNQVIGGQGPVKVRMSPEAMVAIANKIIAAGPVEAMMRYGLELGECGHCGRELTNNKSRAAGIGPKCGRSMGGWH